MAKDIISNEEKLVQKLDIIVELLQKLIILQAVDMNIKKQDIRKITKISMNRVTEITGFVKKEKSD